MPTNTANLNLFKYGSTDGARTFNIDEALNANWDKIDEAVAKKYTKAPTGIPELDLDSAVKAALGKARTALQSVTKADVGLGNVDNTSDASKPISEAQAAKFGEVEGALTTHKADNVSHDTYVSCATTGATAEKVVTVNGFTLVEGARITVNFANANTATTPTLKINTEVAKPLVKADGTAFKNIKAGVYSFVYSGLNFTVQGEGGEYGTATASEVLARKTIGTENGIVTGTLTLSSLGGVKFASGTVKSSITSAKFQNLTVAGQTYDLPYVTVNNLGFTPSKIILNALEADQKYLKTTYEYQPTYKDKHIVQTSSFSNNNNIFSDVYAINGNALPANVSGNSFTLPVRQGGINFEWIAYE